MEIVVNGIISGVFLAFLIGPVFFTIIQTSIERGFICGVFVAAGVSLSDAVYISLSYFGIYQFINKGHFMTYLAYIGGGTLLIFGLYYLFVKSKRLSAENPEHVQVRDPFRLIAKGFIINGLSPMVLIFWIGTIGFATSEFKYDTPGEAIPYFIAMVLTVFATDVIKAKLADKLRLVLTPLFIRRMNILLGIAMIIFGGRLILNADHFTGGF